MLFTLKLRTSTFRSLRRTLMSVRSAPQQFSFLTWAMSDTLVRAMIISSDSLTIFVRSFEVAQRIQNTEVVKLSGLSHSLTISFMKIID